MQIHQSAEDYLETILMLTQRMGRVRSIDVVNELGYTKASVSIAMKKLRENGYIAVDGEGNLNPSSSGPRDRRAHLQPPPPADPFLCAAGRGRGRRRRGCLQGRAYPERADAEKDP